MTEHDALRDSLKGLKLSEGVHHDPSEAQIVSVLRRGKRRRIASFAGAGIGAVAIVALVWALAFTPSPKVPVIPPSNEPRVSAGYEIRSGDVTFKGSAASCGEFTTDPDFDGPYCMISVGFSSSEEGIFLQPEDIYLMANGIRYEVVNEQDEDWEDYHGPNYFFEEPLRAHRSGGADALFVGLPQPENLHYPLELHLRAPGGVSIVIEFPECAVIIAPDNSASTPCD